MAELLSIILAAGKGTRMKSDKIKVLHPVAGKAIIKHVLNTLEGLNSKIVNVIGHQKEKVQAELEDLDKWDLNYVIQSEQLGTGHAVKQAADYIENHSGPVLILYGDTPLLRKETILEFVKKHKKICLLHFDAHADLRDSYEGEKFSHASAIRRCLDYPNVSVISFGIRNISQSEIPFLKKNSSRINIFWAKDKAKWNLNKFKKMIKNKTVYLTFDVDGLDSSIMPATGTPEPGGLLWDETLKIIRIASKNSNIIGADINELAPIKNFNSYNFLVAKLAYKILSYKFLSKKLA